jgi:hypothetical protein
VGADESRAGYLHDKCFRYVGGGCVFLYVERLSDQEDSEEKGFVVGCLFVEQRSSIIAR